MILSFFLAFVGAMIIRAALLSEPRANEPRYVITITESGRPNVVRIMPKKRYEYA